MNNTNTGGAAFPALYAGNGTEGMTLRDYFAAKAMQALIAREVNFNHDLRMYTEAAYEFADEMLKARNK
jgi:hypothetical protein